MIEVILFYLLEFNFIKILNFGGFRLYYFFVLVLGIFGGLVLLDAMGGDRTRRGIWTETLLLFLNLDILCL